MVIVIAGLTQLNTMELQVTPDGKNIVTKIEETKETTLNDFLDLYQKGAFQKIKLIDNTHFEGYQQISQSVSQYSQFLKKPLIEQKYRITTANKPADSSLAELGISLTGSTTIEILFNESSFIGSFFTEQILPLLFFVLLLFLVMRYFGPKNGGMPFSISAGKLKTKSEMKTRFSDIAGMEEVKQELSEIVDYLKNPQKYQKVGARPPKGVLLFGQPGSGKTLLARAVAGEANVPFFSASGSEFMEMLVGMGAAKVRELFTKAKQASPSIIFIDEIDAIGKKRGSGYTGGHQEQEQTLNQILTEMDGFDTDTKIIVIAATNRPDTLDPALLRTGRFDRKVMVNRPTLHERIEIIDYYLKDKKVSDTVDLNSLARRTSGFVGADIETLVNEASLRIAKDHRQIIEGHDFEYALEKIVMGPEKKIKSLQDIEKKIVTYHELGHAVTAFNLEHADPVEKISIVSRGMALGVTWMLPQEDKFLISKAKFLDELVTLLGGRAAEEVFFGKEHITTGASNDFERATKIATDMITKYGMDDELGLASYTEGQDSFNKPFSEKTAEKIDTKVKELLADAYKKSKSILQKNKSLVETMASILIEKEYLTKSEFENLMKTPSEAIKMLKNVQDEKKIVIIEADAIHVTKEKKSVKIAQKKNKSIKKKTSFKK
ncbi:MAG TPA: ATP-dependent zinc metalloprotease FtsH [Candidatus Absconditabacterales bacterium]|nr:ATP-dependent zinc metalloprotease FtsH [Candidatus Absconditabacterales bacterium]